MKCPQQNTRWSLVTRTLKRSAMVSTPRPGNGQRQPDVIVTQGREDASGNQIGRRSRVTPVAVFTKPIVECRKRKLPCFGQRPASVQHALSTAARVLGHRNATLTHDQAVGVMGEEFEVRTDNRVFEIAPLAKSTQQRRQSL